MGLKLVIGLSCALAGCNTIKEMFKDGTITGKIESKGELGNWVLDKGLCFSGQRENYFGAIAVGPDKSGVAIKLVKDPVKGWSAIVNEAPSCAGAAEKAACKARVFTPETCKKLEADVTTTNTTVNDVKVVNGRIAIDCEAGTSSVRGELTLTYCH